MKKEFGVIFHVGIYSVFAYDSVDSAKRRGIQNGSEWYLQRLSITNDTYRNKNSFNRGSLLSFITCLICS